MIQQIAMKYIKHTIRTINDMPESQKILVIEDNTSIAKMLQTILELEGHTCVVANDGRNGLALIENQKFNVILLDIAMPEFSGLDVIESLEKTGKLNENKIIVLSATISDEKINELRNKGIRRILRKPVETAVLLEAISS
jgi:CheY-like chemotaxis protein